MEQQKNIIKERLFEKDINNWYTSDNNQSLVVLGARQVGKTTGIINWANKNNIKMLYINLFDDNDILKIIINAKSSEEIIRTISLLKNTDENSIDVLFLDEVQIHPDVLYVTRLFLKSKIKLICSGSLLGLKLLEEASRTDVGSKLYLEVFPLDFREFLIWIGKEKLVYEIEQCFKNMKQINSAIHNHLLKIYNDYLVVGGMPKVAIKYVENGFKITDEIYKIKQSLLDDYMDDNRGIIDTTNLYTKINIKIANIMYDKMDSYIIHPNNKRFVISDLNKSYKYKNISIPLDILKNTNIAFAVNRVDNIKYPLQHHVIDSYFKLFYNDIGLLTQKLNIKEINLINWEDNEDISDIMGGIIESSVAINIRNKKLFYWSDVIENTFYEVDFIFSDENLKIIPIEVKSKIGTFKKAKSLKVYEKIYNPSKVYCLGQNNFSIEDKRYYVPYYAAFLI